MGGWVVGHSHSRQVLVKSGVEPIANVMADFIMLPPPPSANSMSKLCHLMLATYQPAYTK